MAEGRRGGKRLHGLQRAERLHHAVARDLGIAIVTGRYQPGEVLLGEHAASETLGVSRVSYREAIRWLAAKGLVEGRPKAGTWVSPRARWNLLDPDVLGWILENGPDLSFLNALLELRSAIEPAAAALAAGRRTEADLQRLGEALDGMGRAAPDSPAGQEADEHFHSSLIAAAGNELLTKLHAIVSVSVSYIAEFKRAHHVPRDPKPDHDVLYDAIARRQPDQARAAMLRLIAHARDDVAPGDVPAENEAAEGGAAEGGAAGNRPAPARRRAGSGG